MSSTKPRIRFELTGVEFAELTPPAPPQEKQKGRET